MSDPAGPVGPAPFLSTPSAVRPEWIDHNGHLNLAYYVVLFDEATDALWRAIGVGEAYRAQTGCATFAAETHTLYKAELLLGDETTAHSLVLDADAKRLHIAHELRRTHDDVVAARQELLFLNVDLATRRSAPWPIDTLASLQAARAAHAGVPRPDWVGRRIAMPARP
jgi:acyl-CoA thioester hydrolase